MALGQPQPQRIRGLNANRKQKNHPRYRRRGLYRFCRCPSYYPNTQDSVVNVDKLTYAGNLESLTEVANNPRYALSKWIFATAPNSTAYSHNTSRMP